MQFTNVVVLSGQTAGLGVIRALGSKGVPITVVYHDPREMGRASKYACKQIQLPDPEAEEVQFIDCLLDDRLLPAGEVLVPTSDATLAAVSRHKSELMKKFIVACPDWGITQIFLEKKLTANVAERVGIPVPHTFMPHSLGDVEQISTTILYPALAKPSQSHLFRKHFGRKMTMVNSTDELVNAYQEAEAVGVELMIQEFIPGEDALGANYNAYYWEGQPLVEFTAQKIRSAPPTMGSPSALISQDIPEIVQHGRKVLGSVGFSGFACSEYKRDPRDGQYKLIEVNVRHNLSSALAVSCGMNFPWIEYLHLTKGERPLPRDFQDGVYWVDISRDARSWIPEILQGKYSLKSFTLPYLHKHVFAIYNFNDLKPAIQKAADTARWIFQRSGEDLS